MFWRLANIGRQRFREVDLQPDGFGFGPGQVKGHLIPNEGRHIHRLPFQGDQAGFDPRQVEQFRGHAGQIVDFF